MSVNARRSSSSSFVVPSRNSDYEARDVVPKFVPDVEKLASVNMMRIRGPPRPVVEFEIGWTSHSSHGLKAWDKFYASSFNESDMVKCDGGCGQEYDQNDIVQFGCDHNICKECLAMANGMKNFDGSPGCSRCALSRSSSFSGNSSVPTAALRDSKVRLVIISKEKGELVRYKEMVDMRGRDDLSLIQERLESLVKDIENSMIYITMKLKFHRRDLIPVDKIFGSLASYAKPGQMLTVVVATRGIRFSLK